MAKILQVLDDNAVFLAVLPRKVKGSKDNIKINPSDDFTMDIATITGVDQVIVKAEHFYNRTIFSDQAT